MDHAEIASIMLHLQNIGCHNINLVTPSHVVPQILKALDTAVAKGLNIPLVYNCSGYESLETLEILSGIIDIYMPDFKFWDAGFARDFCHAPDYPQVARAAIREMYDQVGDLTVDSNGVARSGLLVRHLVMPGCLDETHQILKFLEQQISPHTHVNLMSQYRPMGDAARFKPISRPLTPEAFRQARNMARQFTLNIIQ